ncbi:hypothetical protein GCM10023221_04610 [Luteimicrobium xylanilyticum]|uniref:Putative transmembrane protein n=1 Tax=Luteimicrobium xylanilyticum TaxID=1133546 RepID=A0A5P9Q7J4_9MICO|nr:hypothetical protein [Luteimicrobium xylanilyticum]QFU97246.1 putative transmembrane protein [Luteimicrobium xylanilyticum]
MGIVGADVDELKQLGEQFAEASTRLERLRTTVSSSVRSSGWAGPDADGFRSSWSGHDAKIVAARDLLSHAGKTLVRNAEDQRRTSAVLVGAGAFAGATASGTANASAGGSGGGSGDDEGGHTFAGTRTENSASVSGSGTEDDPWEAKADHSDLAGAEAGTKGSFGAEDGLHGKGEAEAWAGARDDAGAHASWDGKNFNADAKAEAAAGAGASASGEIGYGKDLGLKGEADAFVGGKASAEGTFAAGLSGVSAAVGAHAMAGAEANGKLEGHAGILKGSLEGSATAGAKAGAEAKGSVGPGGLSAEAGFDAMAGASAEVKGEAGIEGATVGGGVEAKAGIGVEAKASTDIGWEDTKVDVHLAGALGIGGGVDLSVDVSPKKLASGMVHMLGF